jgi:hypothetical protein
MVGTNFLDLLEFGGLDIMRMSTYYCINIFERWISLPMGRIK